MKSVWKFALLSENVVTLTLPVGAEPLCVQVQNGELFLWALLDPVAKLVEERRFRIAETGHPIREEIVKYISTFQLESGALIFHVFEVK